MKKLTTISLFIFGVVVTSILTAGLVFYQNNKDKKEELANNINQNKVEENYDSTLGKTEDLNTINPKITTNSTIPTIPVPKTTKPPVINTILSIVEISKHNSKDDCWILINGKVYDITSYFGSHPGGNSSMLATCGEDATAEYMTQDPNATTSRSNSQHSSKAYNLLNKYYIGDFNQPKK